MPDPDVVTLFEAIDTVKGLAAWLQKSPEGTTLLYTPPEGSSEKEICFVPDARRAGQILSCLLLTMGIA